MEWVTHQRPSGKNAGTQNSKVYDPQYNAALVEAAHKGDLQSVQALLEQGGDPNAAIEYQSEVSYEWDPSGGYLYPETARETVTWMLRALTVAAEAGDPAMVRLLLERGAYPDG